MSTIKGHLELVFVGDGVYLNAKAEDGHSINLACLQRGHNPMLKRDYYHAIGEVPVSYEIPGFKDLNTDGLLVVRARTQNVRDISFSIIVTHLPAKKDEPKQAVD